MHLVPYFPHRAAALFMKQHVLLLYSGYTKPEVCIPKQAACSHWLCKSKQNAALFLFFFFPPTFCWTTCHCKHSVDVPLSPSSFQSPHRRLLHAGGQEAEAQGWCSGKTFHHSVCTLTSSARSQVHTARWEMMRTHTQCLQSRLQLCAPTEALAFTCARQVSVERKSILYQRPYCIICVIYCTICLQVKIAFKDWWCLQDYTVSEELSDPPSEQWNEIYLTCYLSYIYALSPRVYPEICISAGDYSKRRVPQCCLLFVCLSVLRNFSCWSARHFFSASVPCLLGSSVCRWTNSAKRWTTQTAPSPSSSAETRWSGIR